jgi:hypothetical protein
MIPMSATASRGQATAEGAHGGGTGGGHFGSP